VPGKYDPRGETYELGKELLGFLGMRPAKINTERSLNFKISEYQQGKRNAGQLFTTEVLRGGPVDPVDLVDAYINANRAMFSTQQNMKLDIDAAKTLGLNPIKLSDVFDQRMSRKEFNDIDGGFFRPYTIGKGVEDRIFDISRKIGQPNPYMQSLPTLIQIENILRSLKLLKGQKFPNIINPLKEIERVQEQATIGAINNVQASVPESNINQANLIGNNQQIIPGTGLTRTETALLSPDEQLYYQKQRGIV
jgi:hypothetical protein